MPWSDLPDPNLKPQTPAEWAAAIVTRLGVLGVLGFVIACLIFGYSTLT